VSRPDLGWALSPALAYIYAAAGNFGTESSIIRVSALPAGAFRIGNAIPE
jgi:hypothetical protein